MRKFKANRKKQHKTFTKKRFEKYIKLAIIYEDWNWFRQSRTQKWFNYLKINNKWKNKGL